MGGIEKVSLNIANKIGSRLNKTNEEIAVLKYGLFVILHTSMIMLCMLIIGILTNSVLEIILIALCSAMLKRYSGGIHASTPMKCLIIGVSMSTLLTLGAKLTVNKLDIISFSIVIISGIVVSYYTLYKRCPVGSKQKPLKNEDKRKFLRKKSFELMNIYSLTIFILYFGYIATDKVILKSICISILFGALIQIFALSRIGENVITNIDRILDIGK